MLDFIELITSYLPEITSVVTVIASVVALFNGVKKSNAVLSDKLNTNEITLCDVIGKLKIAVNENEEIKKELIELKAAMKKQLEINDRLVKETSAMRDSIELEVRTVLNEGLAGVSELEKRSKSLKGE